MRHCVAFAFPVETGSGLRSASPNCNVGGCIVVTVMSFHVQAGCTLLGLRRMCTGVRCSRPHPQLTAGCSKLHRLLLQASAWPADRYVDQPFSWMAEKGWYYTEKGFMSSCNRHDPRRRCWLRVPAMVRYLCFTFKLHYCMLGSFFSLGVKLLTCPVRVKPVQKISHP